MKKLFYFFLILVVPFACKPGAKEEGFTLNAKIDSLGAGDAYLIRIVDGKRQFVDTATIDSTGAFMFKGKVEVPEIYYISVNERMRSLPVFLENSQITLTSSISKLPWTEVKGSASHDEFKAYQDTLKILFQARRDTLEKHYMAAKKANDDASLNKIIAKWDTLDNDEASFKENWVKGHPKSFVGPEIVWNELSYLKDGPELEAMVSSMDSIVYPSPYVKLLNDRIAVLKKVAIGQPAIDFTMMGVDGKPVTLSSRFCKYLLVDFWASWCGPCRRENPNVVASWKKFNKKGFDVFGVSLDRDSAAWVKAIKDDKLTWTHVSDLKGWENAAAGLYGVRSIPANFLLDPKGTIIGKNLREGELEKKLAELIK